MRLHRVPVLLAIAALLTGTPIAAAAQWQPPSRFAASEPAAGLPPRRTNYERRAAIVAGVRRGALLGMVVGATAGVVHTQLRDDAYGAAFTLLGWMAGGLVSGGAAGGLVAARRYDRPRGQPSNVALHLTGRPRTVPSSGEPLSIRASFRFHSARR
jgi:hypothetical protein